MEPRYSLIIEWSDEDSAFVASVPELPGCQTHGASYQEAVLHAEDAIRAWLEAAQALGRPVPDPRRHAAQ